MEITIAKIEQKTMPYVLHLLSNADCRALLTDHQMSGIFALNEGVGAGILLFSVRKTEMVIETILVAESYRRKGVGSKLLRTACTLAEKNKKNAVIPFFSEGLRAPLYRFIAASHRFSVEKQDGFYAEAEREVLAADMDRSVYRKLAEIPTESVFEQNKTATQQFIQTLEAPCPYLVRELQYDKEQFDRNLSRCVTRNGIIGAVCLMKLEEESCEMRFLTANGSGPTHTAAVMSDAIRRFIEETEYPLLHVTAVTQQSQRILLERCSDFRITERQYLACCIGTGR